MLELEVCRVKEGREDGYSMGRVRTSWNSQEGAGTHEERTKPMPILTTRDLDDVIPHRKGDLHQTAKHTPARICRVKEGSRERW